ncbi:uncharacterized protein YdeI (YjbR/CyaY-like superfamily) [Maribacter vaceletii]|uniref:Uncharacterized protein YdeI (YjbR/CyaY-like superfamily) n=1 Tax=Maribacter vaceletii TaxID=1206816 RepID=A0A495E5U5_9FLAO|nr:DUF1801 domain-containing protein [Maribacter vaceletii]RKR12314.1 uncharacterized protein YdeI (YjbR/CyaY-like superfamily) [Maribacter vaceletii]
METSEKLEKYFSEEHTFKIEIEILRKLLLSTDLAENFKWSVPTYTINNKNVLSLGKFKNHYGIWFFNGVFLTDPIKVLKNAQEGKTKAMRQWKFTAEDKINTKRVLEYCNEAIENERKGLKISTVKKKVSTLKIPSILSKVLKENSIAKKAFKKLPAYKQKEYTEYIVLAKQEKTKISRLQKIIPLIEKGIGLNDKYRNC